MKNSKICSKCGQLKSFDDFGKNKNGKHGLHSYCLQCKRTTSKEYRRTKDGLITSMFKGMKSASKKRQHQPPNFSKKQFTDWLFKETHFHLFYEVWVENDFCSDLKPSVDRLDNYLPYTLRNINLTTWKQNSLNFDRDRKDGIYIYNNRPIVQLSQDGNVIKEFHSGTQVAREFNLSKTFIYNICKGNKKSAEGLVFRFKDEYFEKV